MSATVPEKRIDPSPVPVPCPKVRPVVLGRVSWPCAELSVTVSVPPSASATRMPLPPPVEKISGVSSSSVRRAGTALVGASPTGLTVRPTVSVSLLAPPAPVLPPSSVMTVRVSLPL